MNVGYYVVIGWVLLFIIVGFFAIRSLKRQAREWEVWKDNLKIGDKVVYSGQVLLTITDINEEGINVDFAGVIPCKNVRYLSKPK